jgi:hypothetical protein
MKMKVLRISPLVLGALALAGLAFTGCLNEPNRSGDASLTVKMAVPDMVPNGTLAKGSIIKLKKMIVTMTSNVVTDTVIRDTILASDAADSKFVTNSGIDQSFNKPYAVKPLRTWTVVVKTLDTRDSVVHKDSVVAKNLFAGETRSITLNLAARFVMYEVKFSVPDSLRSTISNQSQKIVITRFVMKVDSAVAIDSSSPAGFAVAPVVHSSTFDYIAANTTPDVTIQFYGHSAGTNDTLLFEAVIRDVDPEAVQPRINAKYVGPGSDGKDGAVNKLQINIGKVNTVVFNADLDPDIAVKR